MVYNSCERRILLSGDAELNPGPVKAENISAVKEICSRDPNFVLECRILRYKLTPLHVGGGGDCFSSLYHIDCVVIHVIVWNSKLQDLLI